MSQTVCVIVNPEDVARLEAIVADRNRALKHIQRARIVLTSSERLTVQEEVEIGEQSVIAALVQVAPRAQDGLAAGAASTMVLLLDLDALSLTQHLDLAA